MNNLTMWEGVLLASQIGFVFAASVVIGLLVGQYLDSVTNRSPIFLILGAIAGTAAGMYGAIQIVNYIQAKRGNGRSGQGRP